MEVKFEEEGNWFWEVEGIWDLQGDLLISSLMGVCVFTFEEVIYSVYSFPNILLEEFVS